MRLRAKIRRLHENDDQAEEIMALLALDENKPGGFSWIELKLPSWMLSAGEMQIQ